MVHWMHEAADRRIAVVMNPAAFTHYSYALADAAHMVLDADLPLMEVHISNPAARDEFRKRSVISPVATGTITGLGSGIQARTRGRRRTDEIGRLPWSPRLSPSHPRRGFRANVRMMPDGIDHMVSGCLQ